MSIIKPSTAFKAGADWESAEVRAYMKDQVSTHVDTVQDVRDNDFELTRFLWVREKAAAYRLDLSSGAADDGDTVLRDNVGRRYVKVAGSDGLSLWDAQVPNISARAAYDNEVAGFVVLVSDAGDGRAAVYTRIGAPGNWSAPAYLTPAGSGGNVIGPEEATIGNAAVFADGSGKVITDSGIAPASAPVVSAHIHDKNNPHEVTKGQVGLGNVDNTSDADKPVSTAQADAIQQAVYAAVAAGRWLVAGPDGALPVQQSEWIAGAGWIDGRPYLSVAEYLAAASATFARGSDGTYFDRDGILRSAGPNVLRLDHEPRTGKPLGFRSEGQRINPILYGSTGLSSPWWTVESGVTRTTGQVDPMGGTAASLFDGLGTASPNRVFAGGVVWSGDAGQRVEPSLMVRRVSQTGVLLMESRHGPQYGHWEIDLAALADGWEHVTRLHPAVTIVTEYSSNPGNSASPLFRAKAGTLNVALWNAQMEAGAFSSSPILTGATAATRLADSLSYALAGTAEGTALIKARTAMTGTQQTLWQWRGATTANRLWLVRNAMGSMSYFLFRDGAQVLNLSLGNVPSAVDLTFALSWRAGLYAISINGGAPLTYAADTAPLPALTVMSEGSASGGGHWFGTIARTVLWDRAYSPAQLQEMSA